MFSFILPVSPDTTGQWWFSPYTAWFPVHTTVCQSLLIVILNTLQNPPIDDLQEAANILSTEEKT